ncbi:NfeD family protein [Cohnella nanjingensis]|uniref:NfeD family protein n=1 Tax=Cohnella nanjingensis TaxID=1387779 RepID=A0A7X0VIP6_9BACL|nr:NfeD family protein [Cohnella nanjingensis]MBB6674768.1 NfeD family protein [Cohnella nanjingensis]
MEPWTIWLIVGLALIILEIMSLTFYLLCLGLGALAGALVAGLAPDSRLASYLVAAAVAIVLTVLAKPLTRRLNKGRGFRDAIENLVGMQGVVVEAIDPGKPGIVRIGNETWSASAAEPIGAGETVVVRKRGTTVLEVAKRTGGDA